MNFADSKLDNSTFLIQNSSLEIFGIGFINVLWISTNTIDVIELCGDDIR